ncbi:MAG: hypothetical protein HC803_04380 [Saprospiraceae bacterium]|nr:hypothetical protein [Saprospiraceae bacterium]
MNIKIHLEFIKNSDELIAENAKRDLVEIYKILSANFLQNRIKSHSQNSLNEVFYNELLYIIGLEEKGRSNNKILVQSSEYQAGSLIENTITKLRTEDVLYHLNEPEAYGKTENEQLFNVALELVITWLSRIFFSQSFGSQIDEL